MQVVLGPNGKPAVELTQRQKDMLTRAYEFIDTCAGLTAFNAAAQEARHGLQKLVREVTGEPAPEE